MLVGWGLVSMSTAAVEAPWALVVNRFVLGIVEGGVLTSTIVLIRSWFPRGQRARANTVFLLSIPLGSVIANPISGVIIEHMGWRAMFVVEAIPAFVWALVWYAAVADSPQQASWLQVEQRDHLVGQLRREAGEHRGGAMAAVHWTRVFTHPPALWFSAYNFLVLIGAWGFNIWLPSLLKSFNLSITDVGLLSAVPYLAGAVTMVIFAFTSDRWRDRKWHIIVLSLAAGVLMLLEAVLQSKGGMTLGLALLLLTLSNAAYYGRFGAFWALPSEFLPAEVVGIGIAMANGLGNLGGFVGPFAVGLVETGTKSFSIGFAFLGVTMIVGAFCVLPIRVPKTGAVADEHLEASAEYKLGQPGSKER